MWPFKPRVEALARRGDLRGLVKASHHASAGVRLRATAALAAMGSREAVEALVHRTGDPTERAREAAAAALRALEPAEVADAFIAAGRRLAEAETGPREARQWRCEPALVGEAAVRLLAETATPRAAAFLAEAAAGAHPHVDPERAAAALEEAGGVEGVRTIVSALEADVDSLGLEANADDERRLALVGRVCGRPAVEARSQRETAPSAALLRSVVSRAVAALERLVLRPNVAAAAIDALGRIGTTDAIEALGQALTGQALTAFADQADLRVRIVRALAAAKHAAPDDPSGGRVRADVFGLVNRHLSAALRLGGAALQPVRAAACEALADWTPDTAEDHAWLLVAKGLYDEAGELGAAAVGALAEAVRDVSLQNRQRAAEVLATIDLDTATDAVRALAADPDLDAPMRQRLRGALDRVEARAHMAALRSGDPAVRRLAADWLAQHRLEPEPGTENEAFLLAARGRWDVLVERGPLAVEALRLAAREEPLAAATALARLGNDLACDWLGPILRAGGPDQVRAIDALVELGSERAALTLASVLGKTPDPAPVRSALVAIGEPAVGALQPALAANDLALNRLAADILRAIGYQPSEPAEAAVLAVAAGDWAGAAQAGSAAVEPLRRFLQRAARLHAAYDLLTEVASALARVAPAEDLLATIDDERQLLQVRLTLAAGLARVGESAGADRLMRWLFAAPRRAEESPVPWLAALLDAVAERMGMTGRGARAMVAAATYLLEPWRLGEDAVGLRADTAAGTEAVALLAESDVPAALNVLNLAAALADAEVALQEPGYGDPVMLAVDFSARRQIAGRRLRQLGKPPYDPHAYFGLPAE